MRVVGFTGTQEGMTATQAVRVRSLLQRLGGIELRHGDCVGADAQAAGIARALGYVIVAHPPADASKRAWFDSEREELPAPYLERNRAIVDAADVLIAAPRQRREVTRSGTWATVRYARRSGIPVRIITP